jgi:putative ABC transport system permease protein
VSASVLPRIEGTPTMEKIFGIPMADITVALVALLAVCLLAVAWVAWRRPVIFKLGVRNIPRRKAQTILIVVGLMLSTLIISAAFGTGDTMNHSISAEVYRTVGQVDELVVFSKDQEPAAENVLSLKIPASSLATVEQAVKDDPNVDGVAPMLIETVPAVNERSGQGEPEVVLTGINPADLAEFGGLKTPDGKMIDLAKTEMNEVVLSERAAEKLDAKTGDQITIFYQNRPVQLKVAAIAENSVLSGVVNTVIPGMVVPLERMQQATGQTGQISGIAISNKGGVRGAEKLTDSVTERLNTALAGQSLGVVKLKQDGVKEAEQTADIFTQVFLIMGLFSIAAGILLIVLIFTMLAAERRAEMGMARAVGMHRSQLVQQFVSEGAGYAVLAGLVGAALGVAAAIGLAYAMRLLFGQFLPIEPMVQPRSLVAAYSLGVVITFIAVVGSSWKISRLNIVAAIRDIPDVSRGKRKKRVLAGGIALLLFGGLLTVAGLAGDSAAAFLTGMSMLPFGVLVVLRFFGIRGRVVATLVGLYILVLWLLPGVISRKIIGEMNGGIELFFISGIFMVTAATIVIMQNTDILLAGLTRVGGFFKSKLPAVRTAVAYPGAARGRTGMTVAMFSLIVFSLVMMATMNYNFTALFLGDEANAGWDVRASAGSANPIDDFVATLKSKGVDTSNIKAVGTVTTPNGGATHARMPGAAEWKNELVHGMDAAFLRDSKLKFQQRAEGYDSDAAIIQALLTEPNVAVIDSFAVPSQGDFGGDPHAFQLKGLKGSDKTFAPITVEVDDPDGAAPAQWKIIGVIDSKIGTLFGMYVNQQTVDQVFPPATFTAYYLALKDPGDSTELARQIEKAMLTNGVQADSIRDELKEGQKQSSAFLYLIEGFMGLGLIVGVAAVGVIMFRTVVERRQQIGVLRALGYQRGMISLSFLIEAGFIVGLGVISGVALGLALAYNLFHDDQFGGGTDITFLVPWGILSVIVVATIAMALLMTWIPARQAASIAPAEALRYE